MLKKVFSFPTLTLMVALTLSAIAAWYSVLGLTAIFAAAVIPIIIMGGSLEIAKVVTTVWLHKYWDKASWKLKLYLIPAVMALAFLTSMGIFGFLSKSHSDQTLVSGSADAKLVLIDEKIKIARSNIEMNQKALEQMNSQVDQMIGRTDNAYGVNRAVYVRRQQKSERDRLQQEIALEQETIAKLNEESAPIRAEIRSLEAEVGPIKYIAAMIYGDNPDSNLLERAVRWVIILIVLVFDPLALILVLAAQSSYKWLEEDILLANTNSSTVDESTKFIEPGSEINIDTDNNEHDFTNDPAIETDTVASMDVTNAQDEISKPDIIEPTKTSRNDEIKTNEVTLEETDGGYVEFMGKNISKNALVAVRPDLFTDDNNDQSMASNFGTSFPKFAKKGTIFVRVDVLPNKSYKFNGTEWIELRKDINESYIYDEEYLKHLVSKIETGEYDIDLLSDNEKIQIETYLNNLSNS